MLDRDKYRSKSGSEYILIAQSDFAVRQWQVSNRRAVGAVSLAIILVAAGLFFSSDLLVKFIYRNQVREMRTQYSTLTNTVAELQTQLQQLHQNMSLIESKDNALRSYADLPQIDQDIRKMGIGGIHLSKPNSLNEVSPSLESALSEIEMDVDKLTRQVRLQLSSYSSIYDKIVQDTEKMASVPSICPMNVGWLSSEFGYRTDPIDGKIRFHYGQDISARTGTPVYAPADGVVIETRYRGGFGKIIKINHGHGYVTYFGHLSEFNVKKGDKVKRGQCIGKVGNTGRSTAPHLHYEVHYYNTPQNPLDYFFSGYLN